MTPTDHPERTTAPSRPRRTHQSGVVLGDVWEVEHKLGKGGMGSVYRCQNVHAKRIKAAIKLLDPAFQHHPEARARFLREAEILHRIDHPNVVNVASVRLDNSPPFIEMDYVEGISLEGYLGKHGAPELPMAIEWAKALTNAVAYLHRRGIYHRDIKPDNILIRSSDGNPVLVDFGLAVEASGTRLTQPTQTHFGTVSYCPPEWALEGPLDPVAWDCYALGVVLFELLTATIAFPMSADADHRRQVVQVIHRKQELPYLDPGPRIPPDLRLLVQRLTTREPEKRLHNAQEAVRILSQVDDSWQPTIDPVRTQTFEAVPAAVDSPLTNVASAEGSPLFWATVGAVGAFAICSLLAGFGYLLYTFAG